MNSDVTPAGQGRHDAPKYHGINGDILNFAIYQTSRASVLRMFSVSRIHGALGDNGQNYKSLRLGWVWAMRCHKAGRIVRMIRIQ